jgi:hypothetical protein
MGRRKTQKQSNDELDLMLRQASRAHAQALSRILFGMVQEATEPHWVETQLAARQRRVDRAMSAKIGDEIHWQHIEWTERLTRDVYFRVYEYNHLLVMAAHADADAASVKGNLRVQPATVDSVVVVMRGAKKGLPKFGFYRTSSKHRSFSGVRFRIEAIYLRTVAEIEAMGSAFWLVFVPLAIDADEDAIVRAIDTMKVRTNPQHLADLTATMFCVARLRKDRPNFRRVIRSEERRQLMFTNEWLVIGRREGRKEGREQGREQGREEGQKNLLLALFERRLRRSLTSEETLRFTAWLNKKNGAQEMANAVIDLSAEELLARLNQRPTLRRR